jgi:hypothetical protein
LEALFPWTLEADIEDCFANLPVASIPSVMSRDSELAGLLGELEAAGIGALPPDYVEFRYLSNHLLARLDTSLRHSFVRFADDFRVFCDSEAEALAALGALRETALDLGLELNTRKTRIRSNKTGRGSGILASRGGFLREPGEHAFESPIASLIGALDSGLVWRVASALKDVASERCALPDGVARRLERFIVGSNQPTALGLGVVLLAKRKQLSSPARFVDDPRLDGRLRHGIALLTGLPVSPRLAKAWPHLRSALETGCR